MSYRMDHRAYAETYGPTVGDRIRLPDQSAHAAHVDDGAFAFADLRQRDFAEQEHRLEIQVQHEVPAFGRQRLDGVRKMRAGIVHKVVDAAIAADRGRHAGLDALLVEDVGALERHVSPALLHRFDERFAFFGTNVGDDDARAFLGKRAHAAFAARITACRRPT